MGKVATALIQYPLIANDLLNRYVRRAGLSIGKRQLRTSSLKLAQSRLILIIGA